MDLDQLKGEWQKLDERVRAVLRLETQLVREATAARTRSYVGREVARRLPLLVIDLFAVVWLGSFLGDHARVLRFAVPALALMGFAIFVFAASLRQLVLVLGVDYAAPVLANQRQLERVKVERVRVTKSVFVAAPLLWTPLFIVVLAALGVDAYRLFGWVYILMNVLVGVAAVPLLLWLARRYSERLASRRWLKRIADDVAGRNLTAAVDYLASLTAFEQEAQ